MGWEGAINKVFLSIAFVVSILFIILLSISTSRHMPDNAELYIDIFDNTYFSPPCAEEIMKNRSVDEFLRITPNEIKVFKAKPNNICRDQDGFHDGLRPVLVEYLQEIGVFSFKKRWNEDGSWNW